MYKLFCLSMARAPGWNNASAPSGVRARSADAASNRALEGDASFSSSTRTQGESAVDVLTRSRNIFSSDNSRGNSVRISSKPGPSAAALESVIGKALTRPRRSIHSNLRSLPAAARKPLPTTRRTASWSEELSS